MFGFIIIGTAEAYTISDEYIGAWPNRTSYWGQDRIGHLNDFEIYAMEVGFSSNTLTVSIHSTYFDDSVGRLYTSLGDLFISDNGWHPNLATYGPPGPNGPFPATSYDHEGNGEVWEFAVVLDDHADQGPTGSGQADLYRVVDPSSNIILSHSPDGYIYRTLQEVWYTPRLDQSPLASGQYTYGAEVLEIEIAGINFWQDISGFGFHYSLSCGNDVIEGQIPMPEPVSVVLLGSGLLRWRVLGRIGKRGTHK